MLHGQAGSLIQVQCYQFMWLRDLRKKEIQLLIRDPVDIPDPREASNNYGLFTST